MGTTRQWPAQSGFTLIELVTVIAILGVVALTVGGPALSSINDIRSQAASSRLVGDIRYLQRVALSSGQRTWVVFSTGSNSYQMYIENPASPGKAGRRLLLQPLDQSADPVQFGTGPFANINLQSININSTNELEFDSFGIPYDKSGGVLTATATVTLSSGTIVRILPVSGLVEAG